MNHYKQLLSIAAFTMLGLTSCLKDVPNNADASGSNNVVEFQNSSIPVSYISIYPQYTNSFPVTDTAGFPVNLNFAGPQFTAPQDIQITLAIDTAALTAFNNSNSPVSNFVVPPTDVVSFPTTATIKKGTSQVSIKVSVKDAADFDFSAAYVLPLSIKTSSYGIISTNFGTAMYTFGFQNKYDGQYSLDMKTTGWTAYGIADGVYGSWSSNIGLVTSGANSVTFYDYWASSTLLPAFTATSNSPGSPITGQTQFGATTPQFTFDPSSNALVNVVNTTPNDGRNRQLTLNTAVTDSRYDPATGTIYAAFIMTQTGRPTQYYYDTLVYKKGR